MCISRKCKDSSSQDKYKIKDIVFDYYFHNISRTMGANGAVAHIWTHGTVGTSTKFSYKQLCQRTLAEQR